MERPEEILLNLVNIYKTKRLIWDPKNINHFKKDLKEDAWREISAEINIPVDQCKKKMISLLASYRRERNKIKSSMGTGKGRDEIYVSKWFAYETFKFMEDRDLPRKRLVSEMDGISGIEDAIEAEVMPSEQREDEVIQREQDTEASSSTLKSTKRAKSKEVDISASMMNNAFDILKTAAMKLDKAPSQPNEIDSFFTYVAAKVHKYSPEAQKEIQHAVFELLVKADRGLFDWPPSNYQYPSNWQNPAESGPTPRMYSQPYFSQSQAAGPPPTISSPSEPSLPTNSTQQSPAPSNVSENFDSFI